MLNASSANSRSSIIFELIVGVTVIAVVGLGIHQLQHPEMTQQQQIQAAFEH